jgi:hypothetical protein
VQIELISSGPLGRQRKGRSKMYAKEGEGQKGGFSEVNVTLFIKGYFEG